jgi:hypothetical protein
MNNTLWTIIFVILYAGGAVSVIYILSLDVLQSNVGLSFAYFLLVFLAYSVVVNIIGLIYRFAKSKGHPLPGVFSLLMGHLTEGQVKNLSLTLDGKRSIYLYEFLLLRLDILVPAAMVFGVTLYSTIPSTLTTPSAELTLSTVIGVFVLSYLVYTVLQAYLVSVKLSGSLLEEQELRLGDVITMVYNVAT